MILHKSLLVSFVLGTLIYYPSMNRVKKTIEAVGILDDVECDFVSIALSTMIKNYYTRSKGVGA